MLQGTRVLLRAARRDDMEALCRFNNDLAVELAGGGDPPIPQSLERLLAEFDTETAKGGRNGAGFIIEADGQCIGQCALFQFDATAQTAGLGITIGDKDYWGKGYGRQDGGKYNVVAIDYGIKRNILRLLASTGCKVTIP